MEYFAGRSEPDLELLTRMRSHGPTCFMQTGSPGGWVLLTEKPGLRVWEDAARD